MPTNSILINFNGCPSSLDSLMPDNGLANLAGSLLESGHHTIIMDFCTVNIIRRMIPEELQIDLEEIYNESIKVLVSGGQFTKSMLDHLVDLDKRLEQSKSLELPKIAEEIINQALNIDADFIGFKLWTGEGFEGSVKIAEIIKSRLPEVKIIAGGPHVDWFMKNIFDYTDIFDILVYGEGEEVIKLIANYVKGNQILDEIPNIIYKKNGNIYKTPKQILPDLNILADPIYDEKIYPAIVGDQKIKFIMIDESRGCPNQCYFCIHPQKSGNRWRIRDYERIVDLIEKLSRELNTSIFRLSGSNTPSDLRRDIANELIKRNLGISYAGFGHVRSDEDYEFLRLSGCVSLAFGVESGSQQILDQDINKRVKVEQIIRALTGCKRAGILAVASIIAPCPHDTEETLKETLDLLIQTRPDAVTIQLPGLTPNAFWYKYKEQFGFELDADCMTRSMLYKIKLLLPPMMWEKLPYKINGKSSHELTKMAQDLSSELEKHGILTGIGDFLLLISNSMKIPALEMRNINRKMFFTGDFNTIQNMVLSFNNLTKRLNRG
jgi:hypothetical protein